MAAKPSSLQRWVETSTPATVRTSPSSSWQWTRSAKVRWRATASVGLAGAIHSGRFIGASSAVGPSTL
ncbi:hypothetical protein D3C86_1993280 [compost metagenome]